jgi:hypothetical protein
LFGGSGVECGADVDGAGVVSDDELDGADVAEFFLPEWVAAFFLPEWVAARIVDRSPILTTARQPKIDQLPRDPGRSRADEAACAEHVLR